MFISVVNFTDTISDEQAQQVIRAINRQIAEDFDPQWHMSAILRLEGRSSTLDRQQLEEQSPEELRGDAILYLWDKVADVPGALGYHDDNNRGIPYGFVFTEISDQIGEPWSVTLSHEALEMIGDANVNVLAAGPHPANANQLVYHWYEMCDAVQAETYKVDNVDVSNFVLPLYFTVDHEPYSRNDFLNRKHNGQTLRSFGVNPGGYVGFFNPATNQHETYSRKDDPKAQMRLETKSRLQETRRSVRYRTIGDQVREQIKRASGRVERATRAGSKVA